MASAPGVLLVDGAAQRLAPLAERLRTLGFQAVRAKTPEEALQLVESPRYDFAAALVTSDLAVADLRGALASLRDRASRRLACVAVGARPDAEGLARLREAGVELSVWNPLDDGVLRFQLNRAVSSFAGESLRRELRAPTDWRVRFFAGGRPKDATLYSLSAGGAFLSTQRPSLRGAEVAVELPLPAESIAVRGKVLYTNVPGNLMKPTLPLGMAVQFAGVGEDVVDSIRRSVAERALGLVV